MSYFRTFILAALCFFSLNTWAADLYVSTAGRDSNSGTSSAPFRTVQKGANMATPGTTVHVAPGTYIEAIVSNANGTASARIRFVSDIKWAAKLRPPTGTGSVWKSTGGYTDIDGFEIDGTGNITTREGIYLTGGNSTVKNALVHHIAENSGCDGGGGAGIVADQYRGAAFGNYDIIGNIVHHIGNAGCDFIQGIYHASTGTIKNNLVYAVGAYGIHLWHDDHNIDIVNNTVFGCGNGIVYGGADQTTYFGPADFIRIYNNIIFDNTGTGISENTVYGSNNVIQNNLVFKNGTNYNVSGVTGATQRGEIAADPQFVNYIRSGGGDYRLKSTSPAINKGTSTLAPLKDLDGITRPQGAAFDIGAYEYGSSVPAPATTPIPDGVPAISLSATSLTFANQLLGTSSAVQLVTITNKGTASLVFGADSISGDFAFANLGTCDVSLDIGSSCTYSVKFSPTAVGQRTGALIINTNLPAPLNITLSGTGIAPAPAPVAAPIISLSTKALVFSNQLVGTTSAVQLVTITNTGTASLNFSTAFSMTGDFVFGGSGTCALGVSYAPGSNCTASVVFKPTATDARTGALSIPSNASSTPLSVALSGTGIIATVDSIFPQTAITAPLNATSVAVRSNVTIRANASDNVAVKTVEFYVNNILKCTVSAAPYQCVWRVPRTRGKTYVLKTRATDAAGNFKVSIAIVVTSR